MSMSIPATDSILPLHISTLIERQSQRSTSSRMLSVYNPAIRSTLLSTPTLAELRVHSADDVQRQIHFSHQIWQDWQHQTVYHRSLVLRQIAEVLTREMTVLAEIIHLENGKPMCEALAEVRYSIGFFEWYASMVQTLSGRITPSPHANLHIETHHRPVGVCAAITPWNFPLAMLAKKASAAIAAGCSLVAKPAELTPLSALALETLIQQTDVPDGLFSVVITDTPSDVGRVLCTHPSIRKLSFTGSTTVGQILMAQSAPNLQQLSMELGGNAPFIVLESANLDQVMDGLLRSKFRNSGQACISANRIIVERSILPQFLEMMLPIVANLQQIRHAPDPHNADIGPLISPKALQKVERLVKDALSKGATLLWGTTDLDTTQCWMTPIVLGDVTPDMDLWWEEIFGPVIACTVADNTPHAIELANQSHHGLGAYLFTSNSVEIQTLPAQIQTGMVGVNTGAISMPQTPFGGVKQSGFGREGSIEGLFEYLTTQTIFRNIQ